MTSTAFDIAKLPAADPDDKEHRPLSTLRAHPNVRKVIDRAALECDQNRGEFLLTAGVEKAVVVLGAETVRGILESAA